MRWVRLHHERRPGREHRIVYRRELVETAADDPSEGLLRKSRPARTRPPRCDRRQRAQAKCRIRCAGSSHRTSSTCVVPIARTSDASTSKVFVSKSSGSGCPERFRASKFDALPLKVREEPDAAPGILISRARINHPRIAGDVEWPQSVVDEAFGPGHPTTRSRSRRRRCRNQRARRTSAATSLIGERRIFRPECVGHRADGTRPRILREVAGRQLECPALVDRLRMRAVDVEKRPGVLVQPCDITVERPDADRQRRAALGRQLARSLGNHIDDAGHRVRAPPLTQAPG